jgi:hypothetical protein
LFRHFSLYAFTLAERDELVLAEVEFLLLATFLIALSTKTVLTLPDLAGLLTNLPVRALLATLVDLRAVFFLVDLRELFFAISETLSYFALKEFGNHIIVFGKQVYKDCM